MSKLLTRDEFRKAVFERDGHRCVYCRNYYADQDPDSPFDGLEPEWCE